MRENFIRWLVGLLLALSISSCTLQAHEGGHGDSTKSRSWYLADGSHFHGSYISANDTEVRILASSGVVRTIPLESLNESTWSWVQDKKREIQRLNANEDIILISHQNLDESSQDSASPPTADAFAPFASTVELRWDRDFLFVESSGIPDHPMMVGIRAWQQQVPLPQPYRGENAWRIPLHPIPAKKPMSAKGKFLRGAIALAVNGIPIFNPLNNRGDDAYLVGELDEFGGHCGRADDYHYHIAPVHLEKIVGKGKPIGYALDGYPLFGYQDPADPDFAPLDWLNGHRDAQGNYHYHATPKYPYVNGGFFGEVVERDDQVDPQPRAQGVREALPPMRDATITKFKQKDGTSTLTYEIQGKPGTVRYSLQKDGSYQFIFTSPSGRTNTEVYPPRTRRPAPPKGHPQKPGNQSMKKPTAPSKEDAIELASDSADSKGVLSIDCSCDGKGQTPAIAWKNLPDGTKTIAVSMWHEAPDRVKSYWLVYNIPADILQLEQNAKGIGTLGINDKKRTEYDPVCSKGPGTKTYHITVYAFSDSLPIPAFELSRSRLVEEFKSQGLGEQTLDVTYERK